MDCLHFNGLYKPYSQALKIKNIYKNQLKHNNLKLKIVYFICVLRLFSSIFLIAYSQSSSIFLFSCMYIATIYIFVSVDRKSLRESLKAYNKKYKIELVFPELFDQFKYFLCKESLDNVRSLFSIDKALNYVEIELGKFKVGRHVHNPFYLVILSAITIIVFWRMLDYTHVS